MTRAELFTIINMNYNIIMHMAAALTAFIAECDRILERLHAPRDCHYGVWMQYNKPHGWELHDIRYGGLIQRFDTVKRRLADYLEGRVAHLEELEEERLRLYGEDGDGDPIPAYYFLWKRYRFFATATPSDGTDRLNILIRRKAL